MIRADFDMIRLQSSLRRASRNFGETTKQAVVRWGVQTAREMAVETQVWGKTKTKKKQEGAIFAGVLGVLYIIERPRRSRTPRSRELVSPDEINSWIDENRNAKGRTRNLPIEQKKEVTEANLKKALRIRNQLAGMAKGGFLGAGQEIARAQTGTNRISIGRNFLGYAQKHARFGSARRPTNAFRPVVSLINTVRHTSDNDVVAPTAERKAASFGLTKTLQWYRKAARDSLDRRS